jgi:hypothetical protein
MISMQVKTLVTLVSACILILANTLRDTSNDPHYRESYLNVRRANPHLQILLQEEGTQMSSLYRSLVIDTFRRIGFETFVLRTIGCVAVMKVPTISSVSTPPSCRNLDTSLLEAAYDIHIVLGDGVLPHSLPIGTRLNMFLSSSAELIREPLNVTTDFDYLVMPSRELADLLSASLSSTLPSRVIFPINSIPSISFASAHPSNEKFTEKLEWLIIDGVMAADFRSLTKGSVGALRDRKNLYSIMKQDLRAPDDSISVFHHNYDSARKVAVIIEPRITSSLEFVIRNVVAHLPGWGLQIHCARRGERGGNFEYLSNALSDLGSNLLFVPLPVKVSEEWEYNRLLKSYQFWEFLSFTADKVILFQVDTLMLETKETHLRDYFKYAFVGAPWHMDYKSGDSTAWLRKLQRHGHLKNGIGNGGFSLRDVRAMKLIAEKFGCDIPQYEAGLAEYYCIF